jgi:cell pole-organizing protein PopZ
MATNQNVHICTHIKPSGHRCGSPALRGEIFCYFHQRMIRGVRTPPKSRVHPIAILDDPKSIQASLMEIINALVRNTIDYHRAQLILRALHMAAKNARRANFDTLTNRMVEEVPEYPAPREARKHKPAVAAQQPKLSPELTQEDELENQPGWDWSEIRKKIEDNTPFEPPRRRAVSVSTERKLPESAKTPSKSGSGLEELAARLLGGISPT